MKPKPALAAVLFLLLFTQPIQSQSLRDKIGQMLMVGFSQYTNFMDTLMVDIEHRNLGGVLLFGSNIKSPGQVQALTAQLQQSAQTRLLIATDQEGGFVARLNAGNGFENSYTAFELGTVFDSEDSTRDTANRMAQWLYDSGINVNLAPVVDVNVNPQSPAIGYYERSYSADPFKVFDHASWFLDEFEQLGLVPALKHYPGHGSAEDDSHLGFTDITTTWADSELIPYRQLIAQGYSGLVMTGHLFNANLDSIYPASLSYQAITGLLKDSLGFSGPVISDEMLMGAISNNYGFEQAIELAINAGTDILLYRTNERDNVSLVRKVTDIVEQKVISGTISAGRIDDAYDKIMTLKQRVAYLGQPLAGTQIPCDIQLRNFPNPFNAATTVEFSIPQKSFVTVTVYNGIGQKISELASGTYKAGTYRYSWNAAEFASGVYFCRLESAEFSRTAKLILLK